MSKRAGTVVTLDDLLDDIGVDAARFFLVQRSHETAARPRPRPGARAEPGEPGLLRPVRARAGVQHPGPGRRRRPRGRRPARRCSTRPSAPWSCASPTGPSRCREAEERRAPHRVVAYLDRPRARLPRLLPPLPGGGGARRRRGLPAGPLPRHGARSSGPGSTCSASRPRSGCRRQAGLSPAPAQHDREAPSARAAVGGYTPARGHVSTPLRGVGQGSVRTGAGRAGRARREAPTTAGAGRPVRIGARLVVRFGARRM